MKVLVYKNIKPIYIRVYIYITKTVCGFVSSLKFEMLLINKSIDKMSY